MYVHIYQVSRVKASPHQSTNEIEHAHREEAALYRAQRGLDDDAYCAFSSSSSSQAQQQEGRQQEGDGGMSSSSHSHSHNNSETSSSLPLQSDVAATAEGGKGGLSGESFTLLQALRRLRERE
jgi:hypothetical protein